MKNSFANWQSARFWISGIKKMVTALLLSLFSLQICIAETVQKSTPKLKLTEGKAGTPGIMELVLSLVLVLGIILLMAWFVKRMGGLNLASGGAVKVLTGVSLGGREKAVLVQVGKQQLLLGVAPGRVQTLHVLENPIEEAGTPGRDHNFSDKLKSFMNRGKQ